MRRVGKSILAGAKRNKSRKSQMQPRYENHGREADSYGTKEKRGKNEERISTGKKANAFFFPGSYFSFLLFS
jgi:hypothetical protein